MFVRKRWNKEFFHLTNRYREEEDDTPNGSRAHAPPARTAAGKVRVKLVEEPRKERGREKGISERKNIGQRGKS